MDLEYIIFNVEDGIAWIQFNRPEKLNAVNAKVLEELEKALFQCERDDTVRVIILRGNEKAFVAGADVKDMAAGDTQFAYALTDLTLRVQEKLADLPKPTIAAVSGFALGAGCELALCCDFRIAADNAQLGLPEITLGIIPGGGGTQRLPRLVGLSSSAEIIMTGESVKAEKALEIGLVNKVVPLPGLVSEATALAQKLKQRPSMALRAAKTAMRKGLSMSLKEGLQLEQDLFCMLFGTEDKKEGMAAFLEKRKPNYR
jgi:enoyl-CoA hydratase/carnithine racemase